MGTQKNRLSETVLLSTQNHENTYLMGKEINVILGAQTILILAYVGGKIDKLEKTLTWN